MTSTYECFELTVEAGVAHLQLARPEKANSLPRVFWSEFPKAIRDLNLSGEVRVMVLSAKGKVFCAGLDLEMFAAGKEFRAKTAVDREYFLERLQQLQGALNTIEQARFPVIAAVQGACLGAGFNLIAACDFCFATESAEFRIEETNIGMMADLGLLQRLPHLIPQAAARHLALTGETLRANEAQKIGLVAKTYADTETLIEATIRTAKRIAQRPPVAISGIKRAMIYSRDHGVYQSLEYIAPLQAAILSGEDIQRSIQARSSNKTAEFPNLSNTAPGH